MDRLTRRQIEQHCLVLRDALGNIFPSLDDPSREYYWELLDEVGKMALQSLSQEAVRNEALEGLLDGWQKVLEVDTPTEGLCAGKFTLWHVHGPHRHALSIARNSYDDAALNTILGLLEATRTALKREPNAAAQEPSGNVGAETLGMEGNRPHPAPAAPVAEMVKLLRARAAVLDGIGHEEALNDAIIMAQAATLLAKLGQGWIPVEDIHNMPRADPGTSVYSRKWGRYWKFTMPPLPGGTSDD